MKKLKNNEKYVIYELEPKAVFTDRKELIEYLSKNYHNGVLTDSNHRISEYRVFTVSEEEKLVLPNIKLKLIK